MTEKKQNSGKKLLVGGLALALLIAVFVGAFLMFRPKAVEGSKEITITVTNGAGEQTVYEVKTDASYLKQAMEEAEGLTFSGKDGEYGMMIDTINGEKADYTETGSYWSFYVNDQYCNYGIEEQPVYDGDSFGIKNEKAQ